MADINLVCMVCQHGPHIGKPCPNCPTTAVCPMFIRPDVRTAQALTQINNVMLPAVLNVLNDMLDLFCAAFPDAKTKVQAERQELAKKMEEEQLAAQKAELDKLEELAATVEEPLENVIDFPVAKQQ